jgi:glycine cleavage system H protein
MISVAGYELDDGLAYDAEHNLWVQRLSASVVRVGYDPLGAEATGDIVAISLPAVGSEAESGAPLATIEAAKFVGPLPAPVGGTVLAVNDSLVGLPGAINADPYGSWIVELGGVSGGDMNGLVSGVESVSRWFADAVARYRAQGVIAE